MSSVMAVIPMAKMSAAMEALSSISNIALVFYKEVVGFVRTERHCMQQFCDTKYSGKPEYQYYS
jgi:nitrogen regulatory protein PII